jgi:hypothetical protein
MAFVTTAFLVTGGYMLMPFGSVYTVNNPRHPIERSSYGLSRVWRLHYLHRSADRKSKRCIWKVQNLHFRARSFDCHGTSNAPNDRTDLCGRPFTTVNRSYAAFIQAGRARDGAPRGESWIRDRYALALKQATAEERSATLVYLERWLNGQPFQP